MEALGYGRAGISGGGGEDGQGGTVYRDLAQRHDTGHKPGTEILKSEGWTMKKFEHAGTVVQGDNRCRKRKRFAGQRSEVPLLKFIANEFVEQGFGDFGEGLPAQGAPECGFQLGDPHRHVESAVGGHAPCYGLFKRGDRRAFARTDEFHERISGP